MKLLYAILMGIWRDGFGKSGWGLHIFKIRFVEHVVAFLMTAGICWWKDLAWYWCLWVALWIQIEWALAHGPCYDLSTMGKPDKKLVERYKKMIGYELVCDMFPESQWYGFGFDFVLLAIRYTYPLIPICFLFNPVFMTLGLVITALYAMYRYCPYMQKHRLLDVEIWVGFALGLYVAFL